MQEQMGERSRARAYLTELICQEINFKFSDVTKMGASCAIL